MHDRDAASGPFAAVLTQRDRCADPTATRGPDRAFPVRRRQRFAGRIP